VIVLGPVIAVLIAPGVEANLWPTMMLKAAVVIGVGATLEGAAMMEGAVTPRGAASFAVTASLERTSSLGVSVSIVGPALVSGGAAFVGTAALVLALSLRWATATRLAASLEEDARLAAVAASDVVTAGGVSAAAASFLAQDAVLTPSKPLAALSELEIAFVREEAFTGPWEAPDAVSLAVVPSLDLAAAPVLAWALGFNRAATVVCVVGGEFVQPRAVVCERVVGPRPGGGSTDRLLALSAGTSLALVLNTWF
jgi:hypothetical protein